MTGAAVVFELVPNPWAICASCGDAVDYRTAGRNLPCGCVAGLESVCPTWDAYDGCECSDEQKAQQAEDARAALQAALEHREREMRPGLLVVPGAVHAGDVSAFAGGLAEVVRTSDPANTRVLDLRESEPEDAPPSGELGDDVLEQGERWQIPVLIVLVALIVAGIIGTALAAG